MSNKFFCFGWIPNLSGDIFLLDPFSDQSQFQQLSECYHPIPIEIKNLYSEFDRVRIRKKFFSDVSSDSTNEIILIVYLLDENNKLKKWYAFIERNDAFQLIGSADIIFIDKMGLIKFSYNNNFDESHLSYDLSNEMAYQIFFDIRDIYAQHLMAYRFNEDSIFYLLPVIYSEDNHDVDAINAIVRQFQLKIILYLKTIKTYANLKNNPRGITVAIEHIRQGSEELIYAQNFITFYGAQGQIERDQYSHLFSNVIQTMEMLTNEMNTKYTHDRHEISIFSKKQNMILLFMTAVLTILTIAVTVLTFFLYLKA